MPCRVVGFPDAVLGGVVGRDGWGGAVLDVPHSTVGLVEAVFGDGQLTAGLTAAA